MSDTSGALRLAAETGTGTSGALVVFGMILVSFGLFALLARSLRRMRANVESGQFGVPPAAKADRPGAGEHPTAGAATAGTAAAAAAAGSGTGGDGAAGAKAKGSGRLPRQRSRPPASS